MWNSWIRRVLPGLCCLIFLYNCKNIHGPGSSEIASLNLVRGELQLCGGGNLGKVGLSADCAGASGETFERAVSLLHSFEYTEAEKAFAAIIDENPDCAMAYWGVAMCNFHPLWAPPSREELEKGVKILDLAKKIPVSKRVQDYLDAIGAFYYEWDKTDHRTRTRRFEEKMAVLHNRYPEDLETSVFYALALNAAADPSDKSYSNQEKAGTMLESLFLYYPNHPGIAHYIIHNYDYPELAWKALPVARRYAAIAPASAHAQHMPSHIFTRLGLWEESIKSNLNSTQSALCYSSGINADVHWDEELHGMDYLVYAYLQLGENEKALEQYEYLRSFKEIFPVNFKVAYTASAIPSRIALENRNWTEASELELPLAQSISWNTFPWQRSIVHFSRGLGLVHIGKLEEAGTEISQLQSLHDTLTMQGDDYKANQVQIELNTLQAWLYLGKGKKKEAMELMALSANMEAATSKHPVTPGEVLPAGELLADMFLELGMNREALAAYEADMQVHPNRFNGLYGGAQAAERCSEHEKARAYYTKLTDLSAKSGVLRPELLRATAYLNQNTAPASKPL